MKRCKHYIDYIFDDPEKISDECLDREGWYQDGEVADHFWKSGRTRSSSCKHCMNKHRKESGKYDPQLARDRPTDENGRLLNYWHIIEDKNIVLKVNDENL